MQSEDSPIFSYQFQLLMAMNRLGKHVYGGTVSSKTVAKRRAKNKVARRQRKYNLSH